MSSCRSIMFQPSVPVVANINGGFSYGRMVYVCGIPKSKAQRFIINLQEKGDVSHCDIGLHFDVRFMHSGDRKVVVRNNFEGGAWGTEEKDIPYFPFKPDEKFYLIIHARWDKYIISVNNQPFVNFCLRRGPLQRYSVINISGDIDLTENRKNMSACRSLMFQPSIPVVTAINGGFSNGRMVYVCGTTKYNAKRFTINLQEGDEPSPGDIGLHFDVRVNAGDREVVVRNNCENGAWGIEERDAPYFPFRPNEKFYMIIHATWDKYIISVNNQPFVQFRLRRGPLERYSVVKISGDIDLTEVSYQ